MQWLLYLNNRILSKNSRSLGQNVNSAHVNGAASTSSQDDDQLYGTSGSPLQPYTFRKRNSMPGHDDDVFYDCEQMEDQEADSQISNLTQLLRNSNYFSDSTLTILAFNQKQQRQNDKQHDKQSDKQSDKPLTYEFTTELSSSEKSEMERNLHQQLSHQLQRGKYVQLNARGEENIQHVLKWLATEHFSERFVLYPLYRVTQQECGAHFRISKAPTNLAVLAPLPKEVTFDTTPETVCNWILDDLKNNKRQVSLKIKVSTDICTALHGLSTARAELFRMNKDLCVSLTSVSRLSTVNHEPYYVWMVNECTPINSMNQ